MEPKTSRSEPIRHHVIKDVVTAAVLLAIGLVLLIVGANAFTVFPGVVPFAQEELHWWHILPLILACAATCWQSRYPLAVYFTVTAGVMIDMTIGLHLGVLLAWANSVYNAGRYTDGKVLRWSLVVFGATVFCWIFGVSGDATAGLTGMLQIAFTAVISLWWGVEVRGGDVRAEAERLKSLAARRREIHEREMLLHRHRADLATQLHDTISSHLSTIALYTTGALEPAQGPEQHRKVLTEIRRSSLDALTDMRKLIEVLRTFRAHEPLGDEAESTRASSIADMLARLRAAGLHLTLRGNARDHLERRYDLLSQEAAVLLEQVIQEALTNALKHGDGTAILRLEGAAGWMTCTISNPMFVADQRRTPAMADTSGLAGGLGLGTMAAAVHKNGGTFTAGVVADDGARAWTIEVELPALQPSLDMTTTPNSGNEPA